MNPNSFAYNIIVQQAWRNGQEAPPPRPPPGPPPGLVLSCRGVLYYLVVVLSRLVVLFCVYLALQLFHLTFSRLALFLGPPQPHHEQGNNDLSIFT